MRISAALALAPMATLAVCSLAQPALAQQPVALVERIHSRTAKVQFMDYLASGTTIKLARGDHMVVGYLKSCWRETIFNGTVTIGQAQSLVVGGTVSRKQVRCAGGQIALSRSTAQRSGAFVTRGGPRIQVLHALPPIFEIGSGGRLVIERLDQTERKMIFNVGSKQLLNGSFFDLRQARAKLRQGGLYRASHADRQLVFAVDKRAKSSTPSVISRLLRLRSGQRVFRSQW